MPFIPKNEAIEELVEPLLKEAVDMGEYIQMKRYQWFVLLDKLLKEAEHGE